MKFKLLFIAIFIWSHNTLADNPVLVVGKKLKAESFQVNLFTNQYYFPFVGIKNIAISKYHPGISFGYLRNLKVKKSTTLYADARFGVYNHRFIQTGIQLYGDIGYRVNLPYKFFVAGEIGLGYLHSIKHQTTFEADADGKYSKVLNLGRPQLMTGLGIKLGKQIKVKNQSGRLFINYQPWFQMPFIKSYVPLLPNNSMHIGFDFILNYK
jgi:hypothetical protein